MAYQAGARLDPPTPPFIVMELVEGEPLSRRIISPLPVDQVVAFAAQIASAIEAAHEKGIVHREARQYQHHAGRNRESAWFSELRAR